MMVWELACIALLILLNGVFAMSELALVSARRGRLQQWATAGDAAARSALTLMAQPTRFLSTAQIGITLVGIFAGAYGGATFADPLARTIATVPLLSEAAEEISIGVVVIAITYLSLIVGELVPKRIALSHPERIAAWVAGPMSALASLVGPLVWFLRISTETVLRLLRIRASDEATVTEEEIKTLIAEGTEAGVFQKSEREMIEGVLRLADRPVRSIMTPRQEVVWLDQAAPSDASIHTVLNSSHSQLPVARDSLDQCLGIVRTTDLLAGIVRDGTADLTTGLHPPLMVHEGTPVLRLLELLRQSGVHIAVVLDEYGSVEGIVTVTDILRAIAGDLPQAGLEEAPQAVQREDGSWLFDGRIDVHSVERLLQRNDMASDDYATLAGFALWRLEHMPTAGKTFIWRNLFFEIIDMDGRRIDKILVQIPRAPSDAGS
jgi:putative hemolysin